MSKKFGKDRSVPFAYHAVPIYYTGIKHATNNKKELALIDDYGSHFIAAYRSETTERVGINFVLKKETRNNKVGFIYKDKFYALRKRFGWVW